MNTQKDFEATARIIRAQVGAVKEIRANMNSNNTPTAREAGNNYSQGRADQIQIFAWRMAELYAQDNPCFDRARFLRACGLEVEA